MTLMVVRAGHVTPIDVVRAKHLQLSTALWTLSALISGRLDGHLFAVGLDGPGQGGGQRAWPADTRTRTTAASAASGSPPPGPP
ncbi:hypothetical protein [Nonomuraea maritima]|uniref:hypothetical protein n=1 Tax=Nonomuraea maritima TaxID=683260 RepID=UPI0037140D3A